MDDVIEPLRRLEEADIEYCVLRNYEFAMGGDLDGDIDVLVRAADRDRIDQLLRDERYYPFEGDTTRQTRYRGYVESSREIVTIDLYWDEPTYNGLPFLDGDLVLDRRRRVGDIWIPSVEDYFVELVFHPTLNKNRFRTKYRSELEDLREDVDKDLVRSHARRLFGKPGVQTVEFALNGQFEAALDNKWTLVRTGLRRNPRHVPRLVYNLFVLREVIRPLRRVFDLVIPRPKPVVAVLGPDGVGKSTVVKGIQEILEANGLEVREKKLGVHSGAGPLLRGVRRLYNAVTRSEPDSEAKASGSADLGPKSSTLKAAVPVLDWWLRYLRTWLGTGDVLVADRYLHELPVYFEPGPFSRLIQWSEPPVFAGIVLTDDLEALAGRSEFDSNSVETFEDRLGVVELPRVSVSDDPEETLDAVLSEVVKTYLSKRSRSSE